MDHTTLAERAIGPLEANPHLMQLNDYEFSHRRHQFLQRQLLNTAPRIPYRFIVSPRFPLIRCFNRRRQGEHKSVVHWGQRKLLLSEIEFLTEFAEPGDVVLYAGAAPGTHILYLSDLFEKVSFVLVDPAKFKCKGTDRVVVRQEYFSTELAMEFVSAQRVLFICDIRTADWTIMTPNVRLPCITQQFLFELFGHHFMHALFLGSGAGCGRGHAAATGVGYCGQPSCSHA